MNGRPVFPIGFTSAPPPDGKTPDGRGAYEELATLGTIFHRCGAGSDGWTPEAEKLLDRTMDRSAEAGILAAIWIHDLQSMTSKNYKKINELKRVIMKYKDHPGLGFWKGADEPEWGGIKPDQMTVFYDMVHRLDPNHDVWVTQAPRGTIESLKAYDKTYDILAMDIYPVGYPTGGHSHLPNKNISVVGDYAKWLKEIAGGRKPFWMVLQICWSGVVKPGKTLRFPTFPEERYMTYQAIINGARGLVFFGGDVKPGLSERDAKLGWNWSFYYKVLKPVLEELKPSGLLYPALLAPESRMAVKVSGAKDVEFCVREVEGDIFILAAKREGKTVKVTFSGLPATTNLGSLLYEEPRKVNVSGGKFTDWFGPNEVHVYMFKGAGY